MDQAPKEPPVDILASMDADAASPPAVTGYPDNNNGPAP